jgi:ATP-dependent DNA helicase RecG
MLLKDIGTPTKTVNALAKKNIITVDDLAHVVPRKYKNYLKVVNLNEAEIDKDNAIRGHIVSTEIRGERFPKCLAATLLDEETGQTLELSWFGGNQIIAYQKSIIEKLDGKNIVVCGKLIKHDKFGFKMLTPDKMELETEFKPHIMTIYRKFSGVSEKTLKQLIYKSLKFINEPLEIIPKDMLGYKEALYKLHYPKKMEDVTEGARRLVYNDFTYINLKLARDGSNRKDGFLFDKYELTQQFVKALPFALSDGQKNACNKIVISTHKGVRLNALVQGDVGCGKTVVAFTGLINAVENGYQGALLAPTQVLAEQHFLELTERLKDFDLKVAFLGGGTKAKERREILAGLKDGSINIIVGTHAIFSASVEFNNLGMIIIDEEHKFGRAQKQALKNKAEAGAHVVRMSATPIPRSLVGAIYGEDVEIINIETMPQGRKPVQTAKQIGHTNTFPFILKQLKEGHQCYVVCPAIDNDVDEDEEPLYKLKNVKEVAEEYENYFSKFGFKVASLNGKMSKKDMSATIESFANNEAQILVSTTVIEVGVNVPNATIIVVEQAERFGLASLHQLRGRVGRGTYRGYCILQSEHIDNERIDIMCSTNNGFEIAEMDLNMRGGGDIIGDAQSGFDKYVNEIIDNPKLYELAKLGASKLMESGLGGRLISLYEEKDEYESEAI